MVSELYVYMELKKILSSSVKWESDPECAQAGLSKLCLHMLLK